MASSRLRSHLPLGLLLSAAFGFAADLRAQTPAPAEEPTLPEIEVTPPESDATTSDGELQPSADYRAPANSGDAIDLSQSFPNLTDLTYGAPGPFGAGAGILRGTSGSGSLFDTPNAGSIVTPEVLREKQATDMFQALQNEVGVHMQRTAAGQASPFIRGLTGQQVLILVDGVRLNNSITRFGPNQYFNTIDPGMVDHIEVIRGPGSVLWGGDAIGGVINVVSRGPDVFYGMDHGDYNGAEFHQTFNTADSSPYTLT